MVDFKSATVVCIASGPSLNERDCNLVEQSGLQSIAVNSSWRLAPFADVLYAGDARWWDANYHQINCESERWTCSLSAYERFYNNLHHFRVPEKAHQTGWNSGMRAIELAAFLGASKIILLGYDCSVKNGVHWHGLHKNTNNPGPDNCAKWHKQFARVGQRMKSLGVDVVNCSRYTELRSFPVKRLEDELCSQHFPEDAHRRTSTNCGQ